MNKVKKIILGFVVSIIIIVIISISAFFFMLQAPSDNSEEVVVSISGGANQVVSQLYDLGLIKNEFAAKVYVKLTSPVFKANTYILDYSMSFSDICEMLIDGKTDSSLYDKLQVIEGQTIPEVANVVANALSIQQSDVLTVWSDKDYLNTLINDYWFLESDILSTDLMFPLEGYFAPETYLMFFEDETVDSITKTMLNYMEITLNPYKDLITNFVVDGKTWSVHEFITFASVVQNESLFEVDHSKIAGVFIHRLENGTSSGTGKKLQSDVTVNYANQVKKVAVTYADLAVDSKYNTYLYSGIPVGPISIVSTAIIDACLNYEEMEELFFFAINDGSVVYTKTYQEHLTEISKAKAAGLWLQD